MESELHYYVQKSRGGDSDYSKLTSLMVDIMILSPTCA